MAICSAHGYFSIFCINRRFHCHIYKNFPKDTFDVLRTFLDFLIQFIFGDA